MALFTFCRFRFCKSYGSVIRLLSTAQRPIASLDKNIEENTESANTSNQFKNPGATNRGVVRLPVELRHAIGKLIADKSPALLLQEAQKLRNHLDNKKPPLSQEEKENIKAECENKLNKEKPLPDTTYLTQEDVDRIKNSRNSILKKISEQKTYRWKPISYDKSTALTYLVARLSPDFATLTHVFNEIRLRDSNFQPASMFDFGSGVGSGTWAARSCWDNTKIKEIFCVDSSVAMNSLALALLQGGVWPDESELIEDDFRADVQTHNPLLKGLFFRQYLPSSSAIKYDLVVSAHSLLELPSTELRLQTALSLWRKSQGYLVFVEHGSRAAFEVLIEVRDFLLQIANKEKHKGLEGHVFAPCPHEHQCPRLADVTPCNFEVTYEPLFVTRSDKFMKERYSYVILKKGPRAQDDPQWPRIVRPVLNRSGHTVCRLCTSRGTLDEIVITRSKHSKETNRCAKNSQWGDRLPVALSWNQEQPQSDITVPENEEKSGIEF